MRQFYTLCAELSSGPGRQQVHIKLNTDDVGPDQLLVVFTKHSLVFILYDIIHYNIHMYLPFGTYPSPSFMSVTPPLILWGYNNRCQFFNITCTDCPEDRFRLYRANVLPPERVAHISQRIFIGLFKVQPTLVSVQGIYGERVLSFQPVHTVPAVVSGGCH